MRRIKIQFLFSFLIIACSGMSSLFSQPTRILYPSLVYSPDSIIEILGQESAVEELAYNTKASSTLAARSKTLFGVTNLYDGDTASTWIEGVEGYGAREKLSFTLDQQQNEKIQLAILPGCWRSMQAWNDCAIPKTVRLFINDQSLGYLQIKDIHALHLYELEIPCI